ncbi:hypothetical protein KVF89_04260 [Nocardioides carbamazepini]|uniref:hypothetical protein n=1 Tax=Nocardioides carbamazepini TaxID=2854259 RepID=UPI0023523324|nr:hypothetical protein [Nocardioides carbamazepini]MCR1781740.1 hypothetical protein [Nocardioides carbamazepini]
MPDSPPSVSRRLVLAGGIGSAALVLAGCDLIDDVLGDDDDPGVSGAVTPTAPAADADSTLVEGVVEAISATGALATATAAAAATTPGLGRAGARLARIHDAHAAELGGSVAADAPEVPGDAQQAWAALLAAEAELQHRLVEAAQQAHSGALAQVLAAMAASLAQQQAVLP